MTPPPTPRPSIQITFMVTYVHSHFCQQPLPSPCLDLNVQGQFFLIWSCSWKGQLIFSVESSDEIWHNISLFIAKSDKVYIRTTSKNAMGGITRDKPTRTFSKTLDWNFNFYVDFRFLCFNSIWYENLFYS